MKGLLIKKIVDSSRTTNEPEQNKSSEEQQMLVSLDEDSVFNSFLSETKSQSTSIGKIPESKALIELSRYINEGLIPLHEDLIRWWYENRRDFPFLAKVAEECLCITATSDP
ncbi:unnamed protein product [Nezara viridula]|uniref:HAT C-terminal dimerisation domain-containing protein n=1 Tax=Nezara viridula TaxID=85310 RepID=A0A9P0ECK1_NEZVI|nr:unnamed protein product [Nezara viridula]